MHTQPSERISRGMPICDRNGLKIGTIAHVYRYDPSVAGVPGSQALLQRELIEVKTGPFGLGRRLYIPNGFVQDVANGSVFLSKSADEVTRNEELQYKPSYVNDLY
jgi:hypothetical protein